MKKQVDFLVIGAAKAGTTSLFRYLNSHPDIWMPPEKEINFFASNKRFSQGVDWYLSHWRGCAGEQLLWGEASPQYMQDPSVAAKIAKLCPDVRIIALLRNPIDRAFAHYRHAKRRHVERGTFDKVVEEELSVSHQGGRLRADSYLKPSLYGEILQEFFQYFPREQLQVVFSEELEAKPTQTMQDLFGYLEVDATFTDECFEAFYNGGRESLPLQSLHALRFAVQYARKTFGFYTPIEKLLPAPLRRFYLGTRLRLETSAAKRSPTVLRGHARQVLVNNFLSDVQKLESLLGCTVPWAEFSSQCRGCAA